MKLTYGKVHISARAGLRKPLLTVKKASPSSLPAARRPFLPTLPLAPAPETRQETVCQANLGWGRDDEGLTLPPRVFRAYNPYGGDREGSRDRGSDREAGGGGSGGGGGGGGYRGRSYDRDRPPPRRSASEGGDSFAPRRSAAEGGGESYGRSYSRPSRPRDDSSKPKPPRPSNTLYRDDAPISPTDIKEAGKRGDWQQVLAWVEEYGTALFNHVYIGSAFVALKNSLTGDANREKDLKRALESPGYLRLTSLLSGAVKYMRMRQLSNVFNSLAHLTTNGGPAPCDPEALDRMLQKARADLERTDADAAEIESQALSNTAWSIAKMGIATDSARDAMDAIAGVIMRTRCRDFEPQHLSNTALAFAKYQHRPKDKRLASVLAESAIQISKPNSPWPRFTEQQLSNLAWGLSTLMVDDPYQRPKSINLLFQQIETEYKNMVPDFLPQGISNIYLAYARIRLFGLESEQYLESMSMEIVRRAREDQKLGPQGISRFDNQHLGNILWSCRELSYLPPKPTIEALLGEIERRLKDKSGIPFDGMHLGQICLFLGIMCYDKRTLQVSQGLINALCQELILRLAEREGPRDTGSPRCDEQIASNALYCLTLLKVIGGYDVPRETFSSLLGYFSQAKQFETAARSIENCQQVLDAIDGLALLGEGYQLDDLVGTDSEARVIREGLPKLRRIVADRMGGPAASVDEAGSSSGGKRGAAGAGGQLGRSPYEAEVGAMLMDLLSAVPGGLQAAGITAKPEFLIEGFSRAVDYYLERTLPIGSNAAPIRICLECDGPSHSFSNQNPAGSWGDLRGRNQGDTKFRNLMLERRGIAVVPVATIVWNGLPPSKNPRATKLAFLYGQLATADIPGHPNGFFTPEEDEALLAWLEELQEQEAPEPPAASPAPQDFVEGSWEPKAARGGRGGEYRSYGGGGERGRMTPAVPRSRDRNTSFAGKYSSDDGLLSAPAKGDAPRRSRSTPGSGSRGGWGEGERREGSNSRGGDFSREPRGPREGGREEGAPREPRAPREEGFERRERVPRGEYGRSDSRPARDGGDRGRGEREWGSRPPAGDRDGPSRRPFEPRRERAPRPRAPAAEFGLGVDAYAAPAAAAAAAVVPAVDLQDAKEY